MSVFAFGQIDFDIQDYIGDNDAEFSEEHEAYLKDSIDIAQFDRELYEKLKKLMILKSKGQVVMDMDNIDEDFDPDEWFEERRYYSDEDTVRMNVWDENYGTEDGEYVDDWYQYQDELL